MGPLARIPAPPVATTPTAARPPTTAASTPPEDAPIATPSGNLEFSVKAKLSFVTDSLAISEILASLNPFCSSIVIAALASAGCLNKPVITSLIVISFYTER